MKISLHRFALYLLIIFSLNELLVTTIRPMQVIAYGVYQGAVLALSSVEAISIAEFLLGAAALSESISEMNISHAATYVACKQNSIEERKYPTEGAAISAIGKEYAQFIDKKSMPKQDYAKDPLPPKAIPEIQKQISSKCVSESHKTHIIPKTISYPIHAQPIEFKFDNSYYEPHITTIPGGFRATCGDGYFQMQLKPVAPPKPPTRFIEEENFINRNNLHHDLEFQRDLQEAVFHCLNVLLLTNSSQEHVRIEARLKCIDLRLPGYCGAYLNNTINELLSYYFRKDGSLEPYYINDDFEYIINDYFVSKVFNPKDARQILREKKLFRAAARMEDSDYFARTVNGIFLCPAPIGYFLKANFYDSDPSIWKRTIRQNRDNQNLINLIAMCKRNDWESAEKYRSYGPLFESIYQNYHFEYLGRTFNEYGLYQIAYRDPYWQKLTKSDLKEIRHNKEKRDAINAEILMRLDWKKRIQEAWLIPNDAHHVVHTALYKLVGVPTTPLLIDTIFNIIRPNSVYPLHREKIVEAFFERDGTLKDLANSQNYSLRANKSLLKPELHILCHQYNQLIYAHNSEKYVARKSSLEEAIKLISMSIKNDTYYKYQPSIQALYEAIVTNQPTGIIKQEIERFYIRDLACVVDPKLGEKIPEIQTCPQGDPEAIKEPYGCKLPEVPKIESENWPCVQNPPETAGETCGSVQGIDLEVIDTCNWSNGKPMPQIDGMLEEASEEIEDIDKNNKPTSDDEVVDEQGEASPQHQYPKKVRPPKTTDRCWDLPTHDPAIDIDKIDFSLTPYLTEDEIELIKQCIKLFFDVEGFLAHDGALWRILKHEKQKKGALFELEYINELHDQNRTIIRMGYEIKVPEGKVEIDIETDTELIECKSGVWELKRDGDIDDLRKKMLLANKIGNDLQKPFVVVSKKPIPSVWKNWLAVNNINYREITDE